MAIEIWRTVLGFRTTGDERAEPGRQIQHRAVLTECQHEVPVAHGSIPTRLRCPTCEGRRRVRRPSTSADV